MDFFARKELPFFQQDASSDRWMNAVVSFRLRTELWPASLCAVDGHVALTQVDRVLVVDEAYLLVGIRVRHDRQEQVAGTSWGV